MVRRVTHRKRENNLLPPYSQSSTEISCSIYCDPIAPTKAVPINLWSAGKNRTHTHDSSASDVGHRTIVPWWAIDWFVWSPFLLCLIQNLVKKSFFSRIVNIDSVIISCFVCIVYVYFYKFYIHEKIWCSNVMYKSFGVLFLLMVLHCRQFIC